MIAKKAELFGGQNCVSEHKTQYYFHQGSISATIYKQLLPKQILKAQKKTVKLSVFLALLGSALVKAACRMLMKLTQCVSGISTSLT